MHSWAKQAWILILPAVLLVMLMFASCENDLGKIKEISAKFVSQPIDTTRGVEVIYSDSAIVKGKMITPLMIHYATKNPYYILPAGVKIYFYDHDQKETGNIVSDSAIQRVNENITEFHKNAVATNARGETFKTDELIWDQNKKIMYSNKPVQVTLSDGSVMNAINFKSDDKLNNPTFEKATGVFNVNEQPLQ